MSNAGSAEAEAPQNAIVLARDPFAARVPIPFRDALCSRLLGQINHLIDKTELYVLISGAEGSGKTVLRHMFVDQAPKHFVVLALDASAGLRSVDLLAEVAERFGNRRRKSDDIHDLFIAHYSRGKQPVLVIDAAERLESRALHLVAKLAEHGLHLVLFVRSDREASIAEKLDADRIQVLRVAPYDARRTYCYLQHCLAVVGYQGPMPFDRDDLMEIQKHSGGLPVGINKFARERMRTQSDGPPRSAPVHKPDRGASPRVIFVGVVLALLMGVVTVMALTGRFHNARKGSDDASTIPVDVGGDRVPMPVVEAIDPVDPVVVSTENRRVERTETALTDKQIEPDPLPADEPVDQVDIPPDMDSKAPPLDELSAEPGLGDAEHAEIEAAQPADAEEAAESAVAPPPESPRPDEAVDSGADADADVTLSPDNEGVLARNPRHYTMQLVAGPSLNAVRRFAARYEVSDESAIYELDRDGEAHFALIYRDYASREEALDALDALPDNLKARQPWLRRLSSIQKSLGKE
ncbi:MAG: AAA family ATPase [Gammaproteobacteria bacterium]|nr:AAA family ATPase [Gammaproteobacteria bacterium]MCP5138011.1 AAA family ATPase [Gammaproteobacteria bacterium]